MSHASQVLLSLMALGVVVLAAVQAIEYLGGRSIIGRGQFLLRMAMALLLLGCIGGIFVGPAIPWSSRWSELAYLMGLLVAAVVVAILALIDLRWCERLRHRRRAELFRTLADIEETLRKPEDRSE